ncbi:MAG: exonuclease SbcCD subunit D [Acidobacteria bacterium]|nr:exonuclease SbcCD subunit D [Acidobacteriota bacterium]
MTDIKIVHTSDLHLGNYFSESLFTKSQLSKRNREILETFIGIIHKTKELGAGALLITGDLFEEDRVRSADLHRIAEELKSIDPIPVFISPGNHDYYRENGYYDWLGWPDNVHIFRSRHFDKIVLDDINLTIYGNAFTSPEDPTDYLHLFKPEHKEGFSILMYHGSAMMVDEKSPYRPFKPEMLQRLAVDYIALGHYHKRQIFKNDSGDPIASYPGSPEPLNFGEAHPHSFNLVSFSKGDVKVEYIETGARAYHSFNVDCSNCSTEQNVIKACKEEASEASSGDMVKFNLSGMVDIGLKFDIENITDELGQVFFAVQVFDRTVPGYDFEVIAEEETARGLFVRRLKELISEAESEDDTLKRKKLEDAIIYGLQALDGLSPERR